MDLQGCIWFFSRIYIHQQKRCYRDNISYWKCISQTTWEETFAVRSVPRNPSSVCCRSILSLQSSSAKDEYNLLDFLYLKYPLGEDKKRLLFTIMTLSNSLPAISRFSWISESLTIIWSPANMFASARVAPSSSISIILSPLCSIWFSLTTWEDNYHR